MNPELKRNLWLEVTTHRLILTPAIIFAIAYVARGMLTYLALLGFVILAVIWGGRQAAHTVLEEARERTWDIQRMSAMGPWAMTWGKLVGATSVAWYGGLICLAIYLGNDSIESLGNRFSEAIIVIFSAIAVQGVAMTAALVGVRLERRVNSRLSNTVLVIVLILLGFNVLDLIKDYDWVRWYADDYHQLSFTLYSTVFFAAWGITGAYRAMCTELQVRTTPWVWLSFAAFVALYVTGFYIDATTSLPTLGVHIASTGSIVAIVLSYTAAFAAPRDPIDYRRAVRSIQGNAYLRAFEELPLWFSSAALAVVLGVICCIVGSEPHLSNERIDNLGPVALAFAFMMLRDVALLVYFSFHARTGRAAATTLVYIGVLDLLLPALLNLADLSALGSLIMPSVFEAPWFAVAIFAVHAALASTLALRAYRAALPQPETR